MNITDRHNLQPVLASTVEGGLSSALAPASPHAAPLAWLKLYRFRAGRSRIGVWPSKPDAAAALGPAIHSWQPAGANPDPVEDGKAGTLLLPLIPDCFTALITAPQLKSFKSWSCFTVLQNWQ